MKSIFFLLIFSFSLFAVDVSAFDIKGIKLGMTKNQVLKKSVCNNAKINHSYIGKKLLETHIQCDENEYEYLGYHNIHIYLDRYSKVYRITRYKYMDIEPSWKKVKKQILKHYGYTKHIINNNPKQWNELVFDICYGSGCIKSSDNSTYNIYDSYGKILEIQGFTSRSGTSTDSKSNMKFILYDVKRANINGKWEKKQEKLYEKEQKEKASKIDF